MTLDQLSEGFKHLVDAVSIGIVLGTIAQMLPSAAALLTIVWTGIRIYETNTVQQLLGRAPRPDRGDQGASG